MFKNCYSKEYACVKASRKGKECAKVILVVSHMPVGVAFHFFKYFMSTKHLKETKLFNKLFFNAIICAELLFTAFIVNTICPWLRSAAPIS